MLRNPPTPRAPSTRRTPKHAAGRPLHLANAAQLPPPPLPRAVRSHAHSPLPRQHHQRPHRQLQRPHRRHLRHPLPLIPPLALVSTLRPFPLPLPRRALTSAPPPPRTRIPLRKTRTVSPTATASPSGNTASPSGNAPALSAPRLVRLRRAHRLAPFAHPAPDFAPRPSDAGRFFVLKSHI